MKIKLKKIIVAVLLTASVLLSSGLTAFASSDLSGIINEFREQVGNLYTVSVSTGLYSHNDFDRTVTFSASLIDRDAGEFFSSLDRKLDEVLPDDVYFYSIYSNDSSTQYVFRLSHGCKEELASFTGLILPGSSLAIESDEEHIAAFQDSYLISESLDFSGLSDELNARCMRTVSYDSFSNVLSDGGGAVSGNSLVFADSTYIIPDAPLAFGFSKEVVYNVEDIYVATDITSSELVSVAVALVFGTEEGYAMGESACAHFIEYVSTHEDSRYNHPRLRIEKHEGSTSASVEGTEVETDYRLVLRAEGTPEDVSSVLTSVFGPGNNLSIASGSVRDNTNFFTSIFYNRNSITHSINLEQLCEDSGCKDDEINYAFSGSVGSQLLAMSIGSQTAVVSENSASGVSSDIVFSAAVDYRELDYTSLIIAVLVAGAALCVLAFIGKLVRRRQGKKRKIKREDIRYEAVKSVALALVPEQERSECTALEVPSELLNRPTVVIKPKVDDGLDDDDDDPEGVILFSMILRILLMVQIVLFFFPYFNVSKSGILDSVDTLTGLDLFLGFKIGETAVEPVRFILVLLILPLAMLACLLARRTLHRLVLPVILSAGSIFSIFYMISLSESIYGILENAINAASFSGIFVSQPSTQMGYQYSIVIYILLAIGGIVLFFSNIMAGIASNRRKRDEEMRRFEK